jgi:hypothetical protein
MELLIFEVLHEEALSPDKSVILETLMRPAGNPEPFEHMLMDPNFKSDQIEKYRTTIGNIDSGYDSVKKNNLKGTTVIRSFLDRSGSIPAVVENKSRYGFYDPFDKPDEAFIPVNERTKDNIISATRNIFTLLGEQPPSISLLKEKIDSRAGIENQYNFPLTKGLI